MSKKQITMRIEGYVTFIVKGDPDGDIPVNLTVLTKAETPNSIVEEFVESSVIYKTIQSIVVIK